MGEHPHTICVCNILPVCNIPPCVVCYIFPVLAFDMMTFKTAVLLLLLAVVSATKEVLLETTFDISPKDQTDTGFKATDALQLYLQSPKMKWLRSFHMILSGATSNKPQRVALMAFKDTQNWAEFEEDHLVKTHALFDHFWLNSRRVLWHQVDQTQSYPERPRSMEKPGGFTWVFKYSIKDGYVSS